MIQKGQQKKVECLDEEKFNLLKDIYLHQSQFSRIVATFGILIIIMGVGFLGINIFIGSFILLIGFMILIEGIYFIYEDKKKYKEVILEIKKRLRK